MYCLHNYCIHNNGVSMRFVDRNNDLKTLRELYESEGFEFMSLIGRRRVGKTELIKEFLKESDGIYLYISLSDDKQLRLHIAERLNQELGLSLIGEPSWRDIIEGIFKISEDKKLFVAFDEFQRILKINESVPSLLQQYIDENKNTSQMLLCVAGSSIGMVEKLFQSDASLYGRRTRNLRLKSFTYEGVRKWFKNQDFSDIGEEGMLRRYGVFGGTPKYLQFIDGKTIIENIDKEILSPNSLLYDEPWVFLSMELKSPGKYFDIMKFISMGKEKPKEISDQLDLERTSLGYYLKKLYKDLDMIKRLAPVTEKVTKSKKKRYRIKDNFFKFWFYYIYPNKDQLEMGNREGVKEKIDKDFDHYMGGTFEEVVRWIIRKNNGKELLDWDLNRYEKIGSWWDRQGNEIDICGISKSKKQTLLGEVKWSLSDKRNVKGLLRKMRNSKLKYKNQYLIVSREFTPEARELLQEEDVIHFSVDDFHKIF